jgi:hypothetical protein
MADVQITCITKPHPQSPHEHITHVGNPAAGWKWRREEVSANVRDTKRLKPAEAAHKTLTPAGVGRLRWKAA